MTIDEKYARALEIRRQARDLRMQARALDRDALCLEIEADRERILGDASIAPEPVPWDDAAHGDLA